MSDLDPYKQDIDPVGFALERVHTYLRWIEEHRASFEAKRASDPEAAESELDNLRDASEQAYKHLIRLAELILAGKGIDPGMRPPRGLDSLRQRISESSNG